MAFAGENMDKVNSAIMSARINAVIVILVLTIILGAIVWFVGTKLSKALMVVMDGINTLALGKLNADFDCKSGISEIQNLAACGQTLQIQLLNSVGGAMSTAAELGVAVENVDNLSGNSSDGAQKISEAVNELAATAQTMAETVQEANLTVADMGDAIDRITVNVEEMNKTSEVSMDANRTAIEYMDKLEQASEKTSLTVDVIGEKIAECSDAAEKIKKATVAISEIASQTNLLSLNASIEAARAGEAGRGFAVVAGEIQALSEQSNNSAGEIQKVVNEILAKVDECVQKANEMTEVINEQTQFLQETKVKINDMSTAGQDLADGAIAINNEAANLNKLKEIVLGAITDLSAISEENAASSQEVNSTVDYIASAVESTKDESSAMRQLAIELENKMKFFDI